MSDAKLLPCPFCGGAAEPVRAIARSWWRINVDHAIDCVLSGHCDEIDAPQDDEGRGLLIADWNRRTPTEPPKEQT